VSWRPKNQSFTLLLCEQYGLLLKPIEENGGAELKVAIGRNEESASEPISSRMVYFGLMGGMEPTRLQLQEMANVLMKHVNMMQGAPKVWVHDPGGEFGVTNDNWH